MTTFTDSQFVWADGPTPSRNSFVSFEKTFSLDSRPDQDCELLLFADTRFRLWVNERFVAYGPARFVTNHPEFDRFDLCPYLQAGSNRIRVEVNFYGCSSFQTMPDGAPGFIAAGGMENGSVDFATPGDWQARIHESAWRWDAPLFSFAQNPAEICDTRALEAELENSSLVWPVRVLAAEEQPWGNLSERSAPYPDYQAVRPDRITAAGPLAASRTYGFQTFVEGFVRRNGKLTPQRLFATCLHSPVATTVELGCFWGELKLNGKPVEVDTETILGNHGVAELELREGWNILSGRVEILTEVWSYLLRLPLDPELTLKATPEAAETSVFALSPVFPDSKPPLPATPEDPSKWQLPEGWERSDGRPETTTPARLMGWDELEEAETVRDMPYARLSECSGRRAREATWTVQFEREYYGHPVIEVDAPAGTTLDIGYDDWLRKDGCVNLYGANPFTDAADRFILRGGPQVIEVLNPRGGIYLQVTLRAPDATEADLELRSIEVLRRTTLNEEDLIGHFKSGDAVFDYAWTAAARTLCASTDDAYSDCPWRERGSYIGDSLVSINLQRLLIPDLSVGKRTFLNFGRAELPDGQLACCAPAWLRQPHEDFTLVWVLGIRDLARIEPNAAFVCENWPVLQRILAAPYDTHSTGLWNTDGRRLFIDWGCDRRDREGEGNAVINILRIGALRAAAELGRRIDEGEAADVYAKEADALESAIVSNLWNEEEGRFRPSLSHDSNALHANILALCFDIGPRERVLNYLRPHLLDNLKRGLEHSQFSGHVELYFLYHLLPTLGEMGEVELAEQLVLDHYGFLMSLGCSTLNECFHRAHQGEGSCCHNWAGAGGIYAHRYVLGVRPDPENPNRILIEPRASQRFTEASGRMAHPAGPIQVSWSREGDRFLVQADAPDGVELLAGKNVDIRISADSHSMIE